MEGAGFLEAQQAVVQAVVADAPRADWRRLLADIEIREGKDGYHFDTVGIAVVRGSDGTLDAPSFSIGRAAREAMVKLYLERKAGGEKSFGGFELQVEPDGRYRFDFSYDPPKRLNGVWDKEKEQRLDNYLDHYKQETGAAS